MNGHLIEKENEFLKTQEWAMLPKLIRRMKCVLGQMMMQVKTRLIAMQLCQGHHKMCDENNLKIVSKGTKMEHTTKKGFILGPNIRLLYTNACSKEINRKIRSKML